MKATEAKLLSFLQKSPQLVIPIYQRTYSWTEDLQDGRAAYGKRILATVSRELTAEFGGGFGYATVNRAIRFARFFRSQEIVSTLSTQLSWSHRLPLLRQRLHQAIEHARENAARRLPDNRGQS